MAHFNRDVFARGHSEEIEAPDAATEDENEDDLIAQLKSASFSTSTAASASQSSNAVLLPTMVGGLAPAFASASQSSHAILLPAMVGVSTDEGEGGSDQLWEINGNVDSEATGSVHSNAETTDDEQENNGM